jgi:phospholipid/cholesterol/gamma-HCH transport system substrate-binding protein
MKKNKNQPLKLGIFVTLGLFIFIVGIYYLGSKQDLFSSTFTVNSYFKDVKGLVQGNNVRYSGINVGTVSKIDIVSDSTILVKMSINDKVREFIRKDSKVEIGSDGLMGSKIVKIHPGSANAGSISDDDELESTNSLDIEEILKEAKVVIDDGQIITKNLVEMTNKLNNGDGDIAKLLNDDEITTKLSQFGDEMISVSQSIDGITRKINRGEGDLGKLVNDTTITHEFHTAMDQFGNIMSRTDTIANELLIFSKSMNNGNGLVNRLVYDSTMADNVDTTIYKVGKSVDNIVDAAETIEKSWIFNLFSGNNKKERQEERNTRRPDNMK